ncbi:Hypothetical predicted protein, partial [Xyrichtys novacula]
SDIAGEKFWEGREPFCIQEERSGQLAISRTINHIRRDAFGRFYNSMKVSGDAWKGRRGRDQSKVWLTVDA